MEESGYMYSRWPASARPKVSCLDRGQWGGTLSLGGEEHLKPAYDLAIDDKKHTWTTGFLKGNSYSWAQPRLHEPQCPGEGT